MKKTKQFSFILGFVFIISCGYYLFNENKNKFVQEQIEQETQEQIEQKTQEEDFRIVHEKVEPKEFNSLEEKIYSAEYERGRKSFYRQMGIILINDNEDNFDYTVLKEIPEEQKNKYEEITNKAYADGYHKATENFYCPAGSY